jgi:hypothetical protein
MKYRNTSYICITKVNKMKKQTKKTTVKKEIKLPAHLQLLADRFNSNYKNIASDYAKRISFKIEDVTPEGYGN